MPNQEWDELGGRILDIIDTAINEKNYQKLNQTVNRAIGSGGEALKSALNSAFKNGDSHRNSYDGAAMDYDYKECSSKGATKSGSSTQGSYSYGTPGGDSYWKNSSGTPGQQDSYWTTGSGAPGPNQRAGYNPEHSARAYERHKNHSYQNPAFGKQTRETKSSAPSNNSSLNLPALYSGAGGEKVKGILMTTFGGICTGGTSIGLIFCLIGLGMGVGGASVATAVVGGITLASALLLRGGCKKLGSLSRFKNYVHALGTHTYCNFEQLSRAVGKPVKYVKKDIKAMITKGWFLEGHVDQKETCLITSNETYQQYELTMKQLEERQKQADPKVKFGKDVSREVQEVLDKGNEYLVKIRKSNDAIPGEEISAKISRMELIIQKIFQRAEDHPEIIPDLKRLMDYYLPMTVKLLDAYEDMDSQPIQGENIRNSKMEIEKTLDTLNVAFEKILDSVFKDTAWDVSSDISVLNTVLAQEGLTDDDFQRMKREAAQTVGNLQ